MSLILPKSINSYTKGLNSYSEQWSDKAYFEITEIDSKIGAKLAVTPLTENRDRYLCIYLQLRQEMLKKSRESSGQGFKFPRNTYMGK